MWTSLGRWGLGGLAAGLVGFLVLLPSPSRADHDQDQHMEEPAPPPRPPEPLLRRYFPDLETGLQSLPPFIRDTNLDLYFRTFYFGRANPDDTENEAWAIGGWLEYRSGWLYDTLAIGAVGYTSQPLYAPDDRDGTAILAPGQEGITVLGQAYGQLRYKEYALLTGYRQMVNDGYVNPQDNRMLPNTFEGVTLKGVVGPVGYHVGYLWDIKPRNSEDFISMSQQAGAAGDDEGLLLTSVTLTPWKALNVFLGNYYVPEVFNTGFGKIQYTQPLAGDLALQLGIQFTDQRSIGDERLGDFGTWNVGLGARFLYRGLTVGLATHFTEDDASIRSPYGTWPGYLSMIQTDFNRAGEIAWGIGVKYDFGGTLIPWQAPGLSVFLAYVQGTDREDPATGSGLPTTREGDLDVIYNVPAVKGLQFRLRNAYVDEGGERVGYQVRLILNYLVDLL
jgi:outer membrane porin, OprD family